MGYIAPFTVNIIHTSVSQSFAAVRDFALFVIVTVVKNDLILREVRVYLFTSEGILVHDTFSHLIDAAATVMLRKKQSMDGSSRRWIDRPINFGRRPNLLEIKMPPAMRVLPDGPDPASHVSIGCRGHLVRQMSRARPGHHASFILTLAAAAAAAAFEALSAFAAAVATHRRTTKSPKGMACSCSTASSSLFLFRIRR